MEKGVVTATGCAPEGFVGALGGELESMPKANGTACLEFPIVEVKSGLFCGRAPAETIANSTTCEKAGLCCRGELVPKFLCMNFINGVSEPALKSANLS